MTIFDLLNEVLIIGFTTFYVVSVLCLKHDDQLEPRSAVFKRRIVLYDETQNAHVYQLWSLFDYVRYAFGAYIKLPYPDSEGFAIYERTDAVNIWFCPKCLSFWVAGIVCLLCEFFVFDNSISGLILMWVASAGLSTALSKD